MVHGVTPSAPVDEAHGGAARSMDAPHRFELGESAVVGGYDDVAGQHEFDAQGERHALHRGDDRLAAPTPERHRVDAATGRSSTFLHATVELRKVQPCSEVGAVAEQHPAPEVVVGVETLEGVDQLAGHLWRIAVHLGWSVQPDEQDSTTYLGGDSAFGGIEFGHGGASVSCV